MIEYSDIKKVNPRTRVKKLALMLSGSVLLALGVIGIFIPILPTTPFVIGAALCYSNSAASFYKALIKNRYFGPYIENYKTRAGVPKRVKILALCMLWSMLVISIIIVPTILLKCLLAAVGFAVTIHLLTIKTKKID